MQVDDVIRELGELVGIDSLAVNQHGVVHLTIEKVGDLYVDDRLIGNNHFIFVYLMRTYDFISARVYEYALSLCDFRHRYPFIVNPVLEGDQEIGFIIKHSVENFNIQVLRQSIEVLQDLQDKLGTVNV